MGYQFDVKLGDYANLATVIATGTPSSVAFSDIQDNKVFVLETVAKRIRTGTGEGRKANLFLHGLYK